MCDYIEEAEFAAILRERKMERYRRYLARCLAQQPEVTAIPETREPATASA